MKLTKLAALPFLFTLFAHAQDPEAVAPPAPAVSLERGAYAEEYERDLEKALGHYELALRVAEAQQDVARVEAARSAIERVKRRQGEAPSEEEAEALRARMEEVVGGVLDTLESYSNRSAGYERSARELAVFGSVATDALESLFDGVYHDIGHSQVRLTVDDVAAVLAAMETAEADAALLRQSRSSNPVVRRAVVAVSEPGRNRALLRAAAQDPVEAVRSVALQKIARAPQPEDVELLRAALDEDVSLAVRGLYALDREATIASAMAPGASARLRESVAGQVLDDPRGAEELQGMRLVLQLALDPQQRWPDILEGLQVNLAEGWTLPEDVRAGLEPEALARYAEWPARPVVDVLGVVGGLRSLEMLATEPALVDVDVEVVGELLEQIIQRTPRERWVELARILNRIPPPESFGGEEVYVSGELWGAISNGLANLDWWHAESQELMAIWKALDELHRPLLSRAASSWFDIDDQRRVARAAGDEREARRPGSLSSELLPLAQELVRTSESYEIEQGLQALRAIGAVEGLREALAFARATRGSIGVKALGAANALIASDPERARDVLVNALLEGWTLRPGGPPLDPYSLNRLPDPQVVQAFERMWPEASANQDLRVALLDQLSSAQSSTEATALLVEHYGDIPAARDHLRQSVLERVGLELYEPGIELLGSGLRDTSLRVRRQAEASFEAFRNQRAQVAEFEAWRLGEDARRDAVEELLELLSSEDRGVRIGAVEALGTLRATEALPRLARMMREPDAETWQAVRAAIARMSD